MLTICLASGSATTATWVRCGLNFLVPFVVSNAGLLSGGHHHRGMHGQRQT